MLNHGHRKSLPYNLYADKRWELIRTPIQKNDTMMLLIQTLNFKVYMIIVWNTEVLSTQKSEMNSINN